MMKPEILLKVLGLFPVGIIFPYVGMIRLEYCFVGIFPSGYRVFKAMTHTTIEIMIITDVQVIL